MVTRSPKIRLAFANLGRAPSVVPVRQSINRIARHLDDAPDTEPVATVLGLVEIDEGDKTDPTDHELLSWRLRKDEGWRRKWFRSGEPMFFKNTPSRRSLAERINVGLSVAHWLPFRHLNSIVIPTGDGQPDLVVINQHYPLADHQLLGRPQSLRVKMAAAYKRQKRLENKTVAKHHAAGRHVALLADRNVGNYWPRDGEVVAAHKGVDWITVLPADGWTVRVLSNSVAPLRIEAFHPLLTTTVRFVKAN
jgi:hypothetical protein